MTTGPNVSPTFSATCSTSHARSAARPGATMRSCNRSFPVRRSNSLLTLAACGGAIMCCGGKMDALDDAFFSKTPTARLRLLRAPATLHAAHGATPPTLTSPPGMELDAHQAHGNGRQNGRAWTA